MKPCPAARLMVLFAPEAPMAVIYRQGPHEWTQMWGWNTEADEFIPGQWIKGRVHDDSTLSPDGRYVISRVMRGDQHTVLSRPPYFTALAVTVKGLCVGGGFFMREGSVWNDWEQFKAPREHCPLRLVPWSRESYERRIDNGRIESRDKPAFGWDQRGRAIVVSQGRIVVSQGRIGVVEGDTTRWLADLNPYAPESVPPPDWALEW